MKVHHLCWVYACGATVLIVIATHDLEGIHGATPIGVNVVDTYRYGIKVHTHALHDLVPELSVHLRVLQGGPSSNHSMILLGTFCFHPVF